MPGFISVLFLIMETKTTALRRELLTRLINEYGHKPMAYVVKKAKERGIYPFTEDDNEVYRLIESFASFNNLPFGYIEPQQEKIISFELDPEKDIEKEPEPEIDLFYESLIKEHGSLSKKLLALNKLIETYKK